MIPPYGEPSTMLTAAASVEANTAAPGLRTSRPATTPGMRYTPLSRPETGGTASAASRFQAQKTTPKATPSPAVTTMSTGRQRAAAPVFEPVADDGRTACSAMSPPDSLRRHDPDQVRGSAANRTLSAEALPCRMFGCAAERSRLPPVRSAEGCPEPFGRRLAVGHAQPGA